MELHLQPRCWLDARRERQGVRLEQHRACVPGKNAESPSVQQFAEEATKAHQPLPGI